MLKNSVKLQVEKNERKYSFDCEPNAPLGEIFDVLCEMREYILNRMNDAVKQAEKKDEEKECEKGA